MAKKKNRRSNASPQKRRKHVKTTLNAQASLVEIYKEPCIQKFKLELLSKFFNIATATQVLPKRFSFTKNLKKYKLIVESPSIEHSLIYLLELLKRSKVRDYVTSKKKIESEILNSEYESALNNLELLRHKYGLSYWYLECAFGIYNLTDDKNKAYELYTHLSANLSEVENRDVKLLLEKSNKSLNSARFNSIVSSVVDNIEKDSIDSDLIRFLFDFSPKDNYDVKKVLDYCGSLNFIDIYNNVGRCLILLLTKGEIQYQKYFVELSHIIGTPIFSTDLPYYEYPNEYYDSSYYSMLEKYVVGDYEEVITKSLEILNNCPNRQQYYDIYIKSHLFSKTSIHKSRVLHIYLESCLSYIKCNEQVELEKALRLSQQFMGLDCLLYVRLLEGKASRSVTHKNYDEMYFYLYLSSLLQGEVLGKTNFRDFMDTLKCPPQKKAPKFRKIKWLLDDEFNKQKFSNFIELLPEINVFPQYMRNEIKDKQVISLIKTQRLNEVIEIIGSASLTNEFHFKLSTLKLVDEVISKGNIKSDINLLLYRGFIYKNGLIRIKKLALYCDQYLQLQNESSIENIRISSENDIFLLTSVMTLDVIKKQKIRSTNDPLIIRANVLKRVKDEVGLSMDYELELSELIRSFARKTYMKKIGQGRLDIKKDIVRANIISLYDNDFEEIRENVSQHSREISNLSYHDTELLCHELASSFILSAIDVYTVGDYGIENSLNLHFRHNHIVPELRGPFERNNIISMKYQEKYQVNNFFKEQFEFVMSAEGHTNLQKDLQHLSEQIDKSLNTLKDTYLHVYINKLQDEDRLFKYSLSKNTVFDFIQMVNAGSQFEDMVDWVISYCGKKTQIALNAGKELISVGIKDQLSNLMEDLKRLLLTKYDINETHKCISNIDKCISEIHMVCKSTSEWFSIKEHYIEDTNIYVPVDEALDFVQRTNTNKVINHNLSGGPPNILVPGKSIINMFHIFIILFQNAAKSNNKQCTIDISYTKIGDDIEFSICNSYENTNVEKLKQIKQAIENNDYLGGAKKEKGSGLFKICRMLDRDFKRLRHTLLLLDENKFKFIFRIPS